MAITPAKFAIRNAGFNPQLEEDFDTRAEFNKLIEQQHSGILPSQRFEEHCAEYAELSLHELKVTYNELFDQISKDSDKAFRAFKKKHIHGKPETSLSQTITDHFLEEFDASLGKVIDQNLIALVSMTRTVLALETKISLFDVQVVAALKLYSCKVLEMKTGEGKTFVIPVAAVLFGIRARLLNKYYRLIDREYLNEQLQPYERYTVNVVTANDYLARRDYSLLRSTYQFFDLSVSYIQEVGGPVPSHDFFSYDILYCTCRHLCHISLDDMMRAHDTYPQLSRYTYAAILDEIDQILLDEALTPFIISSGQEPDLHEIDIVYQARKLARMFTNQNSLFQIKNENLSLTGIGTYYFSKIWGDFHKTLALDKKDHKLLSKAIDRFIDSPLLGYRKMVHYLLQNKSFRDYLDKLFSALTPIINKYLPFLIDLIAIKTDKLYGADNSEILLKKLRAQFSSMDKREFREFVVTFLCKSDQQHILSRDVVLKDKLLINSLLSFVFDGEKTCSAKPSSQLHDFIDSLVEKVSFQINHYYVMAPDKIQLPGLLVLLAEKETHAVTSAFANLSRKLNRIKVEFVFFNAQDIYDFLAIRDGKIGLSDQLNKALAHKADLNKLLAKEFLAIGSFKLEKMNMLAPILISMVTTVPKYYVKYSTNEIVAKISSLPGRKLDFLRDSIDAILDRFDGISELDMIEEISKECGEAFEELAQHPDLPQELQEDINLLAESIQSDLLVEQSLSGIVQTVKQFNEDLYNVQDSEDLKLKYANMCGFIIAQFITLEPVKELGIPTDLQEEIFALTAAGLLHYLRHIIDKDLFKELISSDSQRELVSERVASVPALNLYFSRYLIAKAINPYDKILQQLQFFDSDHLIPLIERIMQEVNDQELTELAQEHSWLFFPASASKSPSDHNRKTRALSSTALLVCNYYFNILQQNALSKESNHHSFFQLVQRVYNVINFYQRDDDYIIHELDFEVEPNKRKYDRYRERYEPREIRIVDQVTGRVHFNNRWSTYLHSSVEAAEDLLVRGENRSLAQITPQSYFGQYKHLSGLSGTTIVAQEEFHQKFSLDVEFIPTNKKIARKEYPDKVFASEKGCIKEIIFDALAVNYTTTAPILIVVDTINNSMELLEGIQTINKTIQKLHSKARQYLAENDFDISQITPPSQKELGQEIKLEDYPLEEIKERSAATVDFWKACFGIELDPNKAAGWSGFIAAMNEKDSLDRFHELIEFDHINVLEYSLTSDLDTFFLPECFHDPTFIELCSRTFGFSEFPSPVIATLDGRPENLSKESELIKQAGRLNHILISTRVCGRGTDIKVERKPGRPKTALHMFILNHQPSKRHDQQIYGRCGRQGDKGYYRFYNSLTSGIFEHFGNLFQQLGGKDQYVSFVKLLTYAPELEESTILESTITQLQLKNEQDNRMSRSFQKQLGDISQHFQLKVAAIPGKLGNPEDTSTEWYKSPEHEFETNLDRLEKYLQYYGQSIELLQPKLVGTGSFLFVNGFDQKTIEHILTVSIMPFAHVQHQKIVDGVRKWVQSLTNMISPEKLILHEHVLSEKQKTIINDSFTKTLKPMLLTQPKEKTDLKLLGKLQTASIPDQRQLLFLSNQLGDKAVKELLALYTKYVELYKTNNSFSLFANRLRVFKRFEKGSKALLDYLHFFYNCHLASELTTVYSSHILHKGKEDINYQYEGFLKLRALGFETRHHAEGFSEQQFAKFISYNSKFPSASNFTHNPDQT